MFRKFGNLAGGVVRRKALTLIPATVAGPAVARDPAVGGAGEDLLPGTDLCRLALDPAGTPAGLDPTLVRRDITEGRPGITTLVRIQVVDAAGHPVANARVDLWQCDAGGTYARAADADTFLRGTQFSDPRGVVEFVTIYPGRAGGGCGARIHFSVTPALGTSSGCASGDILFPDTVSTFVYETTPAYRGPVAEAPVPDSPPADIDPAAANESYLAQVVVAIDAEGAIQCPAATVH